MAPLPLLDPCIAILAPSFTAVTFLTSTVGICAMWCIPQTSDFCCILSLQAGI